MFCRFSMGFCILISASRHFTGALKWPITMWGFVNDQKKTVQKGTLFWVFFFFFETLHWKDSVFLCCTQCIKTLCLSYETSNNGNFNSLLLIKGFNFTNQNGPKYLKLIFFWFISAFCTLYIYNTPYKEELISNSPYTLTIYCILYTA